MVSFRKKNDDVPRRRSVSVVDQKTTEPLDLNRRYLRNRTLLHTAVGDEPSRSEREHVHAMTNLRRRVLLVFTMIILVITGLFVLLTQLSGQVVVGVASIVSRPADASSYATTINRYFEQHPVERLRFALNSDELNRYVASVNPEVASVTQNNDFGIGTTKFTVKLREPLAGWQMQGKPYYVDAQGVAFEKNYFDEPGVQIVDEAGAAFQPGATVTSTRFLSFVGRIVSLAGEQGMVVTEARLPLGTTREVVVKVSGLPYDFRLSIDRGAGEQVEDMGRVEEYLRVRNLSPRYVDLRVDGRAFYQ